MGLDPCMPVQIWSLIKTHFSLQCFSVNICLGPNEIAVKSHDALKILSNS